MRTRSSEQPADVSSAQRRMILDACAQVAGGSASTQPTRIARLDSPGSDVTAPEPVEDFHPDSFPGYRLERRLHEGGQGVVFRALQVSTQRPVAIKVTRHGPLATADERARFEREVRILGQLNHPNIVAIHDRGRIAGCDYFVMDFVPGRPLDTFVRERRPDIRETLSLFMHVCDAVNAAHLRGIIHRDLKPGNILVTDGSGVNRSERAEQAGLEDLDTETRRPIYEPKILDFGLARLDPSATGTSPAASLTERGAFVGSVPWASPEQAQRSDALDIRTDVYSLGVILYQALTGQMPYSVVGETEEVLSRIIHAAPLRPRTLARQIDAELETILLTCLQKDPERRYQSAGELSREVGRYLRGEPIEAKRDSLAYLIGKYVKRHRGRAAGVAVVATAVVVALVVSVVSWQIALAEKKVAQWQYNKAVREAHVAQAATYLLLGGIGGAMPASGVSGLSAQELVDRLAAQLASQIANAEPEVEAPVRTLLGAAYRSMGEFQRAREQLDRALRLWQSAVFADTREELAKAQDEMGQVFQAEHRFPEAETWFREALATLSGVPQPAGDLRARFLANLGNCLTSQRCFSEARACLRESLETYASIGGSESRASAAVMENLGKLAEAVGAMQEAETWFREAIAIRENGPRGQNTELAGCFQNLGVVLLRTGDPQQAAEMASSALAIRRRVLRGDHPDVASSLSLLGLALTALDRLDEAERALRESLEIRTRLYPEGHAAHWNVGQARSALGGCLLKQTGRTTEAEDLLLSGYDALKTAPPAARKLLAEAAARLETLYETTQDADSAKRWGDVASRLRSEGNHP